MGSIWDIKGSRFDALRGDISTEVLVIGGGMAGILCAYFLHEKGVEVVLAEAKTIAGGITRNTTAKITAQHGLLYQSLMKNAGHKKAAQYLKINQLAVEQFKELSKTVPCDFEEKPAYVYSTDNERALRDEIQALKRLGANAELVTELPITVKIKGAVRLERQAQFHPVKLINGLSKGLNIYENTFVKRLNGTIAVTDKGTIRAKKVIVATHFPFLNRHGSYFLKMYQHRSYVIALENAQNVDGMYVDEKQTGLSFRNAGNLLLIGGGDHRTGEQGGGWSELRGLARKVYPQASERFAWATQDCMTLDSVPYIGGYSALTPNLYVATGFNKWGMTSSMVSAMLLPEMVLGRKSEYSGVFSPSRSMLKKQLLFNGATAVKNLLSPSAKRCTHMGCSLKWNPLQHSWDCPCHGSRFGENGSVIDNPAYRGMK